jgi:anti-sigma B factor antagonist
MFPRALHYLPHTTNIVHLQYILYLTYTPRYSNVKQVINLYINERRVGDVAILDLKGRLRVGGSTLDLHKSIRCLLLEKKILILLNLAGVTYIDSCGLGELVASQVSIENKGGELKLMGLTETLRELLRTTRLLSVFDTYESEAEAIPSFADYVSRVKKPQLSFV